MGRAAGGRPVAPEGHGVDGLAALRDCPWGSSNHLLVFARTVENGKPHVAPGDGSRRGAPTGEVVEVERLGVPILGQRDLICAYDVCCEGDDFAEGLA